MPDLDGPDLAQRFTYHPPTGEQPAAYEEIRGRARAYAETLAVLCPPSRERSLAVTHLEETVMWANASIARHGLRTDMRGRPGWLHDAVDAAGPEGPPFWGVVAALVLMAGFLGGLLTLGFMLAL